MKIIQSSEHEDKNMVRVLVDMTTEEYQDFEKQLKEGFFNCSSCGGTFNEFIDGCDCPFCGELVLPF